MFITPNLNVEVIPERRAHGGVPALILEDKWLKDTEVKYSLVKVHGLWQLTMVYVALTNPFKRRFRLIDTYSSEKKANTYAQILQRAIRKDARGTLIANNDAFDICFN